MTGACGRTAIRRDFVPPPAPLLAVRVTVALPAVEGVPLMTPLVAFTVRPLGRPVALNVRGKLVAPIL